MIRKAWRIVKEKHAQSAFTGEGARLFGGRWNSPGTPIIYTAESQSLAVLEMLVHLDSIDLLKRYTLFEVEIEASLIRQIDRSLLPEDWRDEPVPASVQAIGDGWAAGLGSAVLTVPSALVPGECNLLLNSRHPDFAKLKIGEPIPYRFDSRLDRRRQ